MFLCFGKLPKVQLSVMTNTGKNEPLKLTKLPYNTLLPKCTLVSAK